MISGSRFLLMLLVAVGIADDSRAVSATMKLYPVAAEGSHGIRVSELGVLDRVLEESRYIEIPESSVIDKGATAYWLKKSAVEGLIRQQHPDLNLEIIGPDRIKIECGVAAVSSQRISDAILKFYRESFSEPQRLSITFTQEIRDQNLCQKDVNISVERLTEGKLRRRDAVAVNLHLDGGLVQRLPVWVSLQHHRQAWIAERDHKPGARAENLSLVSKYVDEASLEYELVREIPDHTRLSRSLYTGEPLTKDKLEEVPVVEQGHDVKLLSIVKNITITTRAIAVSDGVLGEYIFARLSGNDALIKAKVVGNNLLLVQEGT